MPLYEYECEACGKRFEKIQKYSDPLVDVCPNCGKGPVKKLLSSPAIQFKGSGFYITDYRSEGYKAAAKKDSSASSGGESSSKPTGKSTADKPAKPKKKSDG